MSEETETHDDDMIECFNCKSSCHPHTMVSHWHDDDLIYICEECEADE